MKDYLENEGYDEVRNSKQTIRMAFQAELITDAELWMEMIQKRNIASHAYEQAVLEETVDYIHNVFAPLMHKLHADLQSKL